MRDTDRSSTARPDAILSMEHIGFTWGGTEAFHLAIDFFELQRGERVLLTGTSGSGKSTLLGLITGIIAPQTGTICVLGQNIGTMRGAARDRFRAEHMGIIFQMFNLLPYASVLDNILLPLQFAKRRRARAAHASDEKTEATRLLQRMDVDPALLVKPASVLSVGQQQRVACARALIGKPDLIIADEPTSALDHGTRNAFLDLLFQEADDAGATVLMVSHDKTLAPKFTRIVPLRSISRTAMDAR